MRGSAIRERLTGLGLAVGLAAALLAATGCSSGGQPGLSTAGPTAGYTPNAMITPRPVTINVGNNPSKGPADAKVTIVEFADFTGAHSAAFALQTLPQIIANYGDKVRVVFLNDLLGDTGYGEKAAEAGECANAQGAFWPYHDLLFQNQAALTAITTPGPTPGIDGVISALKGYAAQLKLDTTTFNTCLDSDQMTSALYADRQLADKAVQDAGLNTLTLPAFFINGNYLSGAKPYNVFKTLIDAALTGS